MLRKPLAYALFFGLVAAGCGDKGSTTTETTPPPANGDKPAAPAPAPAAQGAVTDLKIEDVTKGEGTDVVEKGDQVWVLYTGKLADGTVFDSTAKKNDTPFHVPVGMGAVIEGWDKGLLGMKVGGKRKLSIPWKMAYGENGHDPIPARADLFFDIEVKALVKKGDEMTVQSKDVKKGSGAVAKVGDKVTIDYKWSTIMGQEVDNQKNITVKLGANQIIDGMDYGIRGMRVGGQRHLTLPPAVGYMQGTDTLPPNSVLIVDVTLKKVN